MSQRSARLLFIALFLFSAGDLLAQHALIKAKVEECNAAVVQKDYEKLADLTYPVVIEIMGGRESMIELTRTAMEEMESAGFVLESAEVEEPTLVKKIKKRTFAVVPYRLILKTPDGRLLQKATMLGVSEDDGKSWTFINLSSEELLEMVFPDEKGLNKKLSLPPRSMPELIEEKK